MEYHTYFDAFLIAKVCAKTLHCNVDLTSKETVRN